MSDILGVDGGLSSDSSYNLSDASHIIEKVSYTLLNWIHVNEQAMMFGLALSMGLIALYHLIILPQVHITSIFRFNAEYPLRFVCKLSSSNRFWLISTPSKSRNRTGDLDIIAFDIQGRLHTWQNERSANNHIQIEINDQIGNLKGIGAKVIIHYGDNLKQIRELKASGGFLSLDAPIAHFGLAEHQQVKSIEVVSATKQHYSFTGPFKAGRRYNLTLN